MTVVDALGELLAGRDDPMVPVALRLAALLDDPGTSPRDVAALSRELRQVLDAIDVPQVESEGVFDLESRRREREKRRA